jgi:hypothetical protein
MVGGGGTGPAVAERRGPIAGDAGGRVAFWAIL